MEQIKLSDFIDEVENAYQWEIEEEDNGIIHMFYDLSEAKDVLLFPYTFVGQFEQRGDGSGYEYHYVFQRKSDEKYFAYYSYDGRVEEDMLREVTKEIKTLTVWSFEQKY